MAIKINKTLSLIGILLFQLGICAVTTASAQIDTSKIELNTELNEVVVQTNKLDKRKLLIEQITKFATLQIDTNIVYDVTLNTDNTPIHLGFLDIKFKDGGMEQTLISLGADTPLIATLSNKWPIAPWLIYSKNPTSIKGRGAYNALKNGKGKIDLQLVDGKRFYSVWNARKKENIIISHFLFSNTGILEAYNSTVSLSIYGEYYYSYKDYNKNAYPETIVISNKSVDTNAYITFRATKVDTSQLCWRIVNFYQSFLFAYKKDAIGIKDYEIKEE